jgi:hypothetical protein
MSLNLFDEQHIDEEDMADEASHHTPLLRQESNGHITTDGPTTAPIEPKGRITGELVFAILVCTLGSSFQFGYNTGVMNTPDAVRCICAFIYYKHIVGCKRVAERVIHSSL